MNLIFIFFLFIISIIDGLVMVKIIPNSLYIPQSSCSFSRNVSNLITLQNCIWECENEMNCHTSVYVNKEQRCLLFAENYRVGQVIKSNGTQSSVICYKKNYLSTISCSSTMATPQETTMGIVSQRQTCSLRSRVVGNDIYWSFDINRAMNSSNFIPAQFMNNASCSQPSISGYGSTPIFFANLKQYITVNYPFDLSYRSFTITAWIHYYGTLTQMGIVSQCPIKSSSQCFHLNIKYKRIFMGFYNADLQGIKILDSNRWYHVAAVYDNTSQQQIIYLNGVLDMNQTQRPYQGAPSNITIGLGLNDDVYFNGMIDRISLLNRVMNASEILDAGTLVIYYSFDNSSNIDSGPNQNNGTGTNVFLTTGHINQGLLFNQTYSYFQTKNLILLGNSNYSYSFSFWINPFINHKNSSIIHITSSNNYCLSIFEFDSNSQLIAQSSNGNIQKIIGPKLSIYSWTHIAITYQFNDTLTLYVNGSFYNQTIPFIYSAGEQPVTLTIGYPINQPNCLINYIQFYGIIDEFRLYSRQLNSNDIHTLVY